MKIAVILNSLSLSKNTFFKAFLSALKASFSIDVFETLSKHDAVALASKTVEKSYDIILSAGGDGTIHQVVNGVLHGRENIPDLPAIGVLPLGSGNDFARSIGAEPGVDHLVQRLKNFRTRTIDVGTVEYSSSAHITTPDAKSYFINVVDVGMGPEVVKKVSESSRTFGSAVAYYQSIVSTFFYYRPLMLHAKSMEWEWSAPMRTFAVANGKYYGHGLCIAPEAMLDDGVFEVFACGDVSVLDFIIQSVPLKKGMYVDHKKVFYKKATAVELTSNEACRIEADGEVLGWLPAKVDIIPKKIKILF